MLLRKFADRSPQNNTMAGWCVVLFIALICCLLPVEVIGQRRIPGMVQRADNGEALMGVTISLYGGDGIMVTSAASDSLGQFLLVVPSRSEDVHSAMYIKASALGFQEKMLPWTSNTARRDTVKITMFPRTEMIPEVYVDGKGGIPRVRENAAIRLMDSVNKYRPRNRPSNLPYYQYKSYEKVMMAVSGFPKMISANPLLKRYDFIFENVDTTLVQGKALLPVYLEEKVSRESRGSRLGSPRSQILGARKTELDPRFVNNKNIQTIINHLHSEMDLYANTMLVLNRPFLSPLATGASLFYHYHINDTLRLEDGNFVEVAFEPKNLEDRLFTGRLWISMDGKFAVRRAHLAIGPRSNINFVNDLDLRFEFRKHDSGHFLPTGVETIMNFGLQGAKRGMFSNWVLKFDEHQLTPPEPQVVQGDKDDKKGAAELVDEDFWIRNRPLPLTNVEAITYRNVDSLQRNKHFLRTLSWFSMLMTSYKNVGPFEVGPLEYAYSFNDLEGSRIRIGGRTNRLFSDKFYGETYGAYGFLDEKWKYYVGAAYTLNRRRIGEYPAHYIQAIYQRDVREPGHKLDYLNGDGLFRSFRKSSQNKWLYHRQFKVNHIIEFEHNLRLQTSFTNHWQQAASDLVFQRASDNELVPYLKTTELGVNLRWGPNEEYFQRNLSRSYIINRFPVFNFRYEVGLPDVMGGQYAYHKLRFDASKRVYYSLLGFSDFAFGAGYLFGEVPFPLLDIPMANQSYLLAADSYSLMRDMEFVADRYMKFTWEHRFQGFFLNKVPILKNLKIRELMRLNMYYGGLRSENNPSRNAELFLFPKDTDGNTSTFAMGGRPYMEVSAGFENIFNVLRIEYIKRLSYLHLPNVDKGGFHVSLKFGF